MEMTSLISKKLNERKVYHKLKSDQIFTRRSIVKIPKINENISYLIGVIAGDGALTSSKRKRGGNHYILRIYANSEEYLNSLNDLILKEFNINGRIIKDKRKVNTYCLRISNASIFWYFELLNSKYQDSNLPDVYTNKNLFKHYLAGLIDTDGSISNKRVQLKLKNKRIIDKIFQNIKEANPNEPKINYTNNIPFYYIRFDNIYPTRWKK